MALVLLLMADHWEKNYIVNTMALLGLKESIALPHQSAFIPVSVLSCTKDFTNKSLKNKFDCKLIFFFAMQCLYVLILCLQVFAGPSGDTNQDEFDNSQSEDSDAGCHWSFRGERQRRANHRESFSMDMEGEDFAVPPAAPSPHPTSPSSPPAA